jgi:hypothetical protein
MVERRMQILEVGCNENDVEWDIYQYCESSDCGKLKAEKFV